MCRNESITQMVNTNLWSPCIYVIPRLKGTRILHAHCALCLAAVVMREPYPDNTFDQLAGGCPTMEY